MSVVVIVLKGLLYLVLGLVAAFALFLFGMRFADGPYALVPGGEFISGKLHLGPEPDWSFLKDRGEVEFQLIDPVRSRVTWILEHEGRIYIPSGYMTSTWGRLWKQWPIEAEKDGRAVLRIDGVLYDRELVRGAGHRRGPETNRRRIALDFRNGAQKLKMNASPPQPSPRWKGRLPLS
jgi:hypothetical protein